MSTSTVQHIILTGSPGVGKTTIIQKVCSELLRKDVPVKGFYTSEVREKGKRIGFDVVSLAGEKSSLARIGNITGHKVGQYVVDLQSFESVALPIFKSLNENFIIVIDEIGKMELFSKSFEIATKTAFSSRNTILGTIPVQKGKPIPLVEFVRSHPSVKLITVAAHWSAPGRSHHTTRRASVRPGAQERQRRPSVESSAREGADDRPRDASRAREQGRESPRGRSTPSSGTAGAAATRAARLRARTAAAARRKAHTAARHRPQGVADPPGGRVRQRRHRSCGSRSWAPPSPSSSYS